MQPGSSLGLLTTSPFSNGLAVDAQLLRYDGLSEPCRPSSCDQGSTHGRSPGQFVDVHPRFLRGGLVVWRLPTHPAERGWTTTFRGRRPGRSQLTACCSGRGLRPAAEHVIVIPTWTPMHLDLVRDGRRTMPPLDTSIDSLRVWHCRYQTLGPVGNLHGLRTLVVGTFPDNSLEGLRPLRNLRFLRILHLPKVTDLGPLVELRELQSLALETLPSWDSSDKVTEVESLEPIANLPSLRHLELCGVVPSDRSLAVLEGCRRLVSARFSKYPAAEVKRFYLKSGCTDDHVPQPGAG